MKELTITPSRTLVTSFNPRATASKESFMPTSSMNNEESYFEDGDWVVCVQADPTNNNMRWLSCALSNGEIQVYDRDRLHIQQTYKTQQSSAYSCLITDLVGDASSSNPFTMVSTATDGTITLFDIRQPIPIGMVSMPRSEEQALSASLGFDGSLVAVGSSKAKVHFFDVRAITNNTSYNNNSLLGTYNQTHTKEVTRVRFQSTSSFGTTTTTTTPFLLSAGEDGLACLFDTSQPTEEAAIKNVINVQESIRQVGFFGPKSDAVYCLTGSETLKLYHMEDSICRKDFGPSLRMSLSQLTRGGESNDGSNDGGSTSIDYLVDCHWDSSLQQLLLLAGNSIGNAALFNVAEHDISMSHFLHGGHRGVVRAWTPLSSSVLVTVGEDARLCEWNRIRRQFNAGSSLTTAPAVKQRFSSPHTLKAGGGPTRRRRNKMTATPY